MGRPEEQEPDQLYSGRKENFGGWQEVREWCAQGTEKSPLPLVRGQCKRLLEAMVKQRPTFELEA